MGEHTQDQWNDPPDGWAGRDPPRAGGLSRNPAVLSVPRCGGAAAAVAASPFAGVFQQRIAGAAYSARQTPAAAQTVDRRVAGQTPVRQRPATQWKERLGVAQVHSSSLSGPAGDVRTLQERRRGGDGRFRAGVQVGGHAPSLPRFFPAPTVRRFTCTGSVV